MINIAICDDEPYILDDISSKIAEFMKKEKVITNITCFESGNALLETECDFDIIFLDIQMNGTDGMKTAQELRRRLFKGVLIFITSLSEYVFDSFEVSAYDYLVKPVSTEKLDKTLSRLLSSMKYNKSDKLMIQSGSDSKIIPFDEIIYCEVINKKIYLHTTSGGTVTYYDKIENLENKLTRNFFKCHRSYLINLRHLNSFGKSDAKMKTGESIPVSRLRLSELEKAVADYISENGGKL